MFKTKILTAAIMTVTIPLWAALEINAFAAVSLDSLPSVAQFEGQDYVIYENNDTGGVEVAVIFDESGLGVSLVAESNEQSSTLAEFVFEYSYQKAVEPFERPTLTVGNENVYVMKYCEENGSWVNTENGYIMLLCDNVGDILYSDIIVIEKLYKPYQFWMNHAYNGKNFSKYYSEGLGKPSYIVFSEDGFNYDTRLELPAGDHHNYVSNIEYGNGIYIAVGAPEFAVMSNTTITWANYSEIMYVINEDLEIIHKEILSFYRRCVGFYNGYFYFFDTADGMTQKDAVYKKSADGINFEIINADEYEEAFDAILTRAVKTAAGYVYQTNDDRGYLTDGSKQYPIAYENPTYGQASAIMNYGDQWMSIISDYNNTNSYLTFDGVYSVLRLPTDEKNYRDKLVFRCGNYIYVELDPSYFYRIPIEQHEESVYVNINGNILGFNQQPIISEDRTLVPMRFLFEQLGADVDWNSETQSATATLNNTAVTFAIDDTAATVNSRPVTMDVPAQLVNGKTMVPLRFLSEELGYTVTWDEESRTAIIE